MDKDARRTVCLNCTVFPASALSESGNKGRDFKPPLSTICIAGNAIGSPQNILSYLCALFNWFFAEFICVDPVLIEYLTK